MYMYLYGTVPWNLLYIDIIYKLKGFVVLSCKLWVLFLFAALYDISAFNYNTSDMLSENITSATLSAAMNRRFLGVSVSMLYTVNLGFHESGYTLLTKP